MYRYQALNNQGEFIEGESGLSSRQRVVEELLRQSYVPIKITPLRATRQRRAIQFAHMGKRRFDLQPFAENLHDYLDSGLSIDKALELEAHSRKGQAEHAFLIELLDRVRQGGSLSQSMKSYPEHFSPLHIGIVQVGEETDSMTESFRLLSSLLSDLNEFRQKIRSALAYPIILSSVLMISILVLFGIVIPRFEKMFRSMGIGMDGLTGLIIDLSHLITDQYPLLLATLLLLILGLRAMFHRLRDDNAINRRLLQLPVLGDMIRQYNLYIFAMIMSILLKKNIAMIKSLSYAAEALKNIVFKRDIERMSRELSEGKSVQQCIDQELFTRHFVYIVRVGEETGKLPESFAKLARHYYKQLNKQIQSLMLYIEPAIILLLGVIVGVVVITMLQAILSVNELVM